MEFKRDLLRIEKKSYFRVVIGIFLLLFSVAWIFDRIIENQTIRVFDWLYTGIFALNGIIHSFEGLGFSVAKLFGKAFILINNDVISIKLGVMKKEQTVYWNDIKSIDYKLNKFIVQNIDNSNLTIDVSKIDYALKNEIKDIIAQITKDKNLQTIN